MSSTARKIIPIDSRRPAVQPVEPWDLETLKARIVGAVMLRQPVTLRGLARESGWNHHQIGDLIADLGLEREGRKRAPLRDPNGYWIPNSSQTHPKLIPNSSQKSAPFRNETSELQEVVSQTHPKLIPNSSQTHPKREPSGSEQGRDERGIDTREEREALTPKGYAPRSVCVSDKNNSESIYKSHTHNHTQSSDRAYERVIEIFAEEYPANTRVSLRDRRDREFFARELVRLVEIEALPRLVKAMRAYVAQCKADGKVGGRYQKDPHLFLQDGYWQRVKITQKAPETEARPDEIEADPELAKKLWLDSLEELKKAGLSQDNVHWLTNGKPTWYPGKRVLFVTFPDPERVSLAKQLNERPTFIADAAKRLGISGPVAIDSAVGGF